MPDLESISSDTESDSSDSDSDLGPEAWSSEDDEEWLEGSKGGFEADIEDDDLVRPIP